MTFPVQGAPADAARPSPAQLVRDGPAHGVAIQPWQRSRPGTLTSDVSPHILRPPGEVVPGTGFEDDDADAAAGELER